MSLNLRIDDEIKQAMKSRNADALSTLRMLKSAIMNDAINKKKNQLEDTEILEIIQKQVKQRRESIDSFKAAARIELAQKEEREIEVLQTYLPKQLSEAEIKNLVEKAIASTGATKKTELGKIMKVLMPDTKGRADGKVVSDLAQSMLQ
ncbi:MAG: GatB/YqeY domain-containing protein [Candidatus Omnitrophica bacterium]|nr:GatB/YqeY domain-containing protein [Candidatus Omnitrophota bacterium]